MFNIMLATLGVLVFLLNAVVTLALGADKSVTLVPERSMLGKEIERQPVFWEWDGSTLKQHPEKEEFVFRQRLESFNSFNEQYQYMDTVIAGTWVADVIYALTHDQKDKYLVVLVRPAGFESFYYFRGYLERRGVDLGYEPVNADWKLRIRKRKPDVSTATAPTGS